MGQLFDEIQNSCKQRIQPNKMDEFKAKMSEEEYQDLMDALQDTRLSTVVIARVLKTKGYEISANTVLNWRHRLTDGR